MPQLYVVTKAGSLIDVIDLEDMDLAKPVAQAALMEELRSMVRRAEEAEQEEQKAAARPEPRHIGRLDGPSHRLTYKQMVRLTQGAPLRKGKDW